MMSVPQLVAGSLVLNEWAESMPKQGHIVQVVYYGYALASFLACGRDRFLTRHDVSSSIGGWKPGPQ